MACPTCSHTMQSISRVRGIFWCPRCGTVKIVQPDATYVPWWSEERAQVENLDAIAGPPGPPPIGIAPGARVTTCALGEEGGGNYP